MTPQSSPRGKEWDRARATLGGVRRFAERASNLLAASFVLRESARHQTEMPNAGAAATRPRDKPITTLKDVAGRGVWIGQLERAGYRTVADVLNASSHDLSAIPEVGPRTVQQAKQWALLAAAQVQSDTDRIDPAHNPGRAGGSLT